MTKFKCKRCGQSYAYCVKSGVCGRKEEVES